MGGVGRGGWISISIRKKQIGKLRLLIEPESINCSTSIHTLFRVYNSYFYLNYFLNKNKTQMLN